MTMTVLPVEKLKEMIGDVKKSDWLEVSQERINQFADCTDDHQFIHVDVEKAREGPFGQTIAHGFLTLSLLSKLSSTSYWIPEGTKAATNYGFNKIRFISPVPSGSKIQTVMELTDVQQKSDDKVMVTVTHTVSVEGAEKPSLIAEWLNMFFI